MGLPIISVFKGTAKIVFVAVFNHGFVYPTELLTANNLR
ncbi:hypothetical protein SAMN05443574_1053 [Haloarcula vallismortis]|uniref:Uncharacterized protein n=1 Tax=Haloarcula vallismortis TaxID=28442 RepID=A0A1H2UXK6_HALVA|nr:hypothetical protein SAMN05443574_1053 [Haloarcula vallismortis]